MRWLALALALCACQADALFKPLPQYKWGCLEKKTFLVIWWDGDGAKHAVGTSWCVREGWVRK